MVATRQSKFFRAALVAFNLCFIEQKVITFTILPLHLREFDSSVRGIDVLTKGAILIFDHCNRNVEALVSPKHVTVIEIVLLNRLKYVNTLFTLHYADFVARINYKGNQKQNAAECAHFRRLRFHTTLTNVQTKLFSEAI